MTLAEAVYPSLGENGYLLELYEMILARYAAMVTGQDGLFSPLSDDELSDALDFADLLSSSCGTDEAERQRNWGQEIAVLLAKLYPGSEEARITLAGILARAGNFRSIGVEEAEEITRPFMDEAVIASRKASLAIPGEEGAYYLPQQRMFLDSFSAPSFSYSGPTSMGKTFLMVKHVKERVLAGADGNFAIIVPTKALVSEAREAVLRELGADLHRHGYRVAVSRQGMVSRSARYILVLTPERLLSILIEDPAFSLRAAFFDEAYQISEKGPRSAFYYKIASMLRERDPGTSMVFASPNVPNPGVYLSLCDGPEEPLSMATEYSPVSQVRIKVSMRTGEVSVHDARSSRFIDAGSIMPGEIADIIWRLASGAQALVYCNSREDAVRLALEYAARLPAADDRDLITLSREIRETIHGDYHLARLVLKGVAYHIGCLPPTLRKHAEDSYRKGKIRVMFCTSTLLEGVNLPASALFVASPRKGRGTMDEVLFRNLLGRAGRFGMSLCGTVFLLCDDEKQEKAYSGLLSSRPRKQTLSVSSLGASDKKDIVSILRSGNLAALAEKNGQKDQMARKFALILLSDIIQGKSSYVSRQFDGVLSDEDRDAIRCAFSLRGYRSDDDLGFSADQAVSLRLAIERDGMSYPRTVSYNDVLGFLERMAGVLSWDLYERRLTGGAGHGKLRYYAYILTRWMRGFSLNWIISDRLDYLAKTPGARVSIAYGKTVQYDSKNPEHKNAVINGILKDIEDDILFTVAGCFRRFSYEWKRVHGREPEDDWHLFVSFGSSDKRVIKLQRLGYSREAADHISKHASGLISRGKLLYGKAMACEEHGVAEETKLVWLNFPEVFTDE